jgi:hypothetical protein
VATVPRFLCSAVVGAAAANYAAHEPDVVELAAVQVEVAAECMHQGYKAASADVADAAGIHRGFELHIVAEDHWSSGWVGIVGC